MLPVEVRIMPTFEVVTNLNMLNAYSGLTIPLIASATATFLFRQFFLTITPELIEAAKIDGAGRLDSFSLSCCRYHEPILLPFLLLHLFMGGTNIFGQCLSQQILTTTPL